MMQLRTLRALHDSPRETEELAIPASLSLPSRKIFTLDVTNVDVTSGTDG
jgi:hypothetical protein